MPDASDSSGSDSSDEKKKKKKAKKDEKENGKNKKMSKKDKKKAKKAKKLAKKIKKMEDLVTKRKQQAAGTWTKEKKVKKKSSSSSSSSSSEPSAPKKGKKAGKIVQEVPPQVVDLEEMQQPASYAAPDDDYAEALPRDRDQSRSRSRSRSRRSPSEAKIEPCPDCDRPLEWSNFAEGDYTEDWFCNNNKSCGSSGSNRGRWRWHCIECSNDFCNECKGEPPKGWQQGSDNERSAARGRGGRSASSSPSKSSEEDSDPEVHEDVFCDHCGVNPIRGPRFKCTTCKDASLCKKCYKRRAEVHPRDHKFFAMKVGVVIKEEPPPKPKKPVKKQSPPRKKAKPTPSAPPEAIEVVRDAPIKSVEEPKPVEEPVKTVQVVPMPEMAMTMQERWQNIGKEYAQKPSQPVQGVVDTKKEKPAKKKEEKKEEKKEDKKEEKPAPKIRGKQLSRGGECSMCHQQVLDSASAVLCSHLRDDGTVGGCQKACCFVCMKRASKAMFGKYRMSRDVWAVLGFEAWWMHERCMNSEDEAAFVCKILPAYLEANPELPKGWEMRKSKSTGKRYFVNEKLGKTQWTPPEMPKDAEDEQSKDEKKTSEPVPEEKTDKEATAGSDSEKEEDEALTQL